MAKVSVDLKGDGTYVEATLVEVRPDKRAKVTVEVDGEQHKVKRSQIAWDSDQEPDPAALQALMEQEEEELSEDGPVRRGDVFPEGIRETYVKGKLPDGGTFIDCGDEVAEMLRGMSLEAVAKVAEQVLGQRNAQGWINLYTVDREAAGKRPLNPGMIRMNLGNRIRAALKAQQAEMAEDAKAK